MTTQIPKKVSSGLLIVSPKGYLLAHATHTKHWDLPKGGIDAEESALDAALRETLEETGLDMSGHRENIVDLGLHPYIPKKDLHLFVLRVEEAFLLNSCKCSTYIEQEGRERFPEADAYAWVPPDKASSYLSKGMTQYLIARGFLPAPSPSMKIK